MHLAFGVGVIRLVGVRYKADNGVKLGWLEHVRRLVGRPHPHPPPLRWEGKMQTMALWGTNYGTLDYLTLNPGFC